jgi:DNA-binding IclR family transcriptional regulator
MYTRARRGSRPHCTHARGDPTFKKGGMTEDQSGAQTPKTPAAPRSGGDLRAVTRCLDILEALAASKDLGVVELAKIVDLQPGTVHRFLSTLVHRDYVAQDKATGRYYLRYKLLELADTLRQHVAHFESLAAEPLKEVRDVSGETATLAVLSDDAAVYIAQEESSKSVRLLTPLGRPVPLHSTAVGKAMLAFQPAQAIERQMAREPFERFTPSTIVDSRALANDLERVRRNGFAVDNGENEDGVVAVAAPIFDHRGLAVAALNVSGPASRMMAVWSWDVPDLLVHRALAISRELGYEQRTSSTARERAGEPASPVGGAAETQPRPA